MQENSEILRSFDVSQDQSSGKAIHAQIEHLGIGAEDEAQ